MLKQIMAKVTMTLAALWLTAYTWLLRVPSEALPLTVTEGEPASSTEPQAQFQCTASGNVGAWSQPRAFIFQVAIWKENDLICVRLGSRKNRQGGSGVMKRACTCPGNPKICPVHWLWEKVLAHVSPGTQPWGGSSADAERKCIREVARQLAVSKLKPPPTHATSCVSMVGCHAAA